MSPAKLLGLAETEDSIIVRAGFDQKLRMLPPASVQLGLDVQDDADHASKVLRRLIALRKRRETE